MGKCRFGASLFCVSGKVYFFLKINATSITLAINSLIIS